MDALLQACDNAINYPCTLRQQPEYAHRLDALRKLIQSRKKMLFSAEGNSQISLWERKSFQQQEPTKTKLMSEDGLRRHLGLTTRALEVDPQTRFIFLLANDSRSPLRLTHEMLSVLLTYHQAMAPFVDLLLSFGQQENFQDFHYTGFFAQSPALGCGVREAIPALGRSSSSLQLCYNLWAPEKHTYQSHWPWSLRQAALYHSMDLENGRATWIPVKANGLLRERITKAKDIMHGAPSNLDGNSPVSVSLAASFATHSILCYWAVEDWRWYVNFLEAELQEHSRKGLYVMADGDPNALNDWAKADASATTLGAQSEPKIVQMARRVTTGLKGTAPSGSTPSPIPSTFDRLKNGQDDSSGIGLAFDKLQRTQDIGDKANEALLVLRANAEVLSALKGHYRALVDSDTGLLSTKECHKHVSQFERRIHELQRVLKLEQSRVEALLKLIEDRKSLLYGLINHQNTRASKISTKEMEVVTKEMHEIAKKTQQETVSMRIITFITLIFLPGTFVSTIMSTDIISWDKNASNKPQKTVFVGAISFFMYLTIPLIFLTFAIWGIFYVLEKRRTKAHTSPV